VDDEKDIVFVVAVQPVADVSKTVRRPNAVEPIDTSQKADVREQFQADVPPIQNQRQRARTAPPTIHARHETKTQPEIERPRSACVSKRAPPLSVGHVDVVVWQLRNAQSTKRAVSLRTCCSVYVCPMMSPERSGSGEIARMSKKGKWGIAQKM
jgi:hypothetical protein